MSKQKIRVDLQILGNTYSLMCDPHARGLFIDAAEHLNAIRIKVRLKFYPF